MKLFDAAGQLMTEPYQSAPLPEIVRRNVAGMWVREGSRLTNDSRLSDATPFPSSYELPQSLAQPAGGIGAEDILRPRRSTGSHRPGA